MVARPCTNTSLLGSAKMISTDSPTFNGDGLLTAIPFWLTFIVDSATGIPNSLVMRRMIQ
jgi:hypothetical protein